MSNSVFVLFVLLDSDFFVFQEMRKNLPLELCFTQEGRNAEKVAQVRILAAIESFESFVAFSDCHFSDYEFPDQSSEFPNFGLTLPPHSKLSKNHGQWQRKFSDLSCKVLPID